MRVHTYHPQIINHQIVTILHREIKLTTSILSAESRRIVLRSFRSREVSEKFLSSFADRVKQFEKDAKVDYVAHNRGQFAYFNFGVQHGSGNGGKVQLLGGRSWAALTGLAHRNLTGSQCTRNMRRQQKPSYHPQKSKNSCTSAISAFISLS